ncbi:hypothetical protein BH10PSE8_BH10PSE8_21950 [soil metagenome]
MANSVGQEETLSVGEIKKRDFRDELKKDQGWYRKWKIWLGLLWNVGTILIISLGAISSFLVLAGTAETQIGKYLVASLTSISAVITAALSQFRVRDLWQLRENGRLEMMELLDALRLVDISDPAKAEQALAPLRARRRELTRQQAQSFFSTTNPVAAPNNPK